MAGKKIAVKFCGGCDPVFDRVDYFRRIRDIAGPAIIWVSLEDVGFDTILLIQGCETACPEKDLPPPPAGRVVSLTNDVLDPQEVVRLLLEK